jgi:hypothetical protein
VEWITDVAYNSSESGYVLHQGWFANMMPIEQTAHSRANFIVGLIVLALTGFGGALAIRLLFFH